MKSKMVCYQTKLTSEYVCSPVLVCDL